MGGARERASHGVDELLHDLVGVEGLVVGPDCRIHCREGPEGALDGELAQQIQDNMFTFDNLETCDNRSIQVLMRTIEPDLLMVGLKGADEPVLLENPVIGAIAAEHGCSPAQVLLAWQLEGGISTIPKSVSPARLQENLAAAEITLTPADLERIAALDQNLRLVNGSFWLMEGSPWSLQSLWDGP